MASGITNRQREIIEVVGKVLTRYGVSGLTTKRIADAVGFTEGALYRHFKSKEEVIVTMLNFLKDNIIERLSTIVDSSADAEDKFRMLFRSQYAYLKTHPHFVVSVFSDGLLSENQQITDALKSLMAVKRSFLQSVIDQGRAEGVFTRDVSGVALTNVVMGAFRLLMFQWKLSGFEFDIEAAGEELINTLLVLIKERQ